MLLKSIPLRRDCTSSIQGLDMPHLPVYNGATKKILQINDLQPDVF